MNIKALLTLALMPCFAYADITLDIDLKTGSDDHITQRLVCKEQEQTSFEDDTFLFQLSATAQEECALISIEIYRKAQEGPMMVCHPQIQAPWGEEVHLECTQTADHHESSYTVKIVATRD